MAATTLLLATTILLPGKPFSVSIHMHLLCVNNQVWVRHLLGMGINQAVEVHVNADELARHLLGILDNVSFSLEIESLC